MGRLNWQVLGAVAITAAASFISAAPLAQPPTEVGAPVEDCSAYHRIVSIAQARNPKTLLQMAPPSSASFAERTFYALKAAQLAPHDQVAAQRLVALIPQNDEEQVTWMDLATAITCVDRTARELEALGEFQASLPATVSKAAAVAPVDLARYVRHLLEDSRFPHSQLARSAQIVCRAHPSEFRAAVDRLLPQDREWFDRRVFDADRCRSIRTGEQ